MSTVINLEPLTREQFVRLGQSNPDLPLEQPCCQSFSYRC